MDLNRVILIGRIASDVELKYTNGIPVAQFRVAVNRQMSSEARQNGQEKQADFISIVAWRQSAEYVSNYLGKGRLVAVEGRLQIREYQTQDGQNRREYEVVAETIKGLDRPKEGNEPVAAPARTQQQPAQQQQPVQQRSFPAPRTAQQHAPPVEDELDDPFADN